MIVFMFDPSLAHIFRILTYYIYITLKAKNFVHLNFGFRKFYIKPKIFGQKIANLV